MPKITLPTLHPGQVAAFNKPGRNKVIRCGRRWGKSVFGGVWVADGVAKGMRTGWFTPDYKIMKEAWREVIGILDPIIKRSSETDKIIETVSGGILEFWTLDNERAGRSRKYHRIVLDEIAFAKNNMEQIWDASISPTLLDYEGRAMALSTPNGDDPDNFFWKLCNDPKYGFTEYHAPTSSNPYMPARELARLKEQKHPLVFKQEYEAEFVDWKSNAFFDVQNLLEDGVPVPQPVKIDYVFATLDTAMKGGEGNDGTAITFFGVDKRSGRKSPMFVLDWEIVEIEGALLETWLPQMFKRLEELARETKARDGALGVWIEDKATGSILLQQGKSRGWPVEAINSKITSVGKDARAVNASGYIARREVMLTRHAYEKLTVFRGASRNHFLGQVFGFRIADPDANKRADDLLDTFCYGIAVGLGNNEGF